MRWRVYSLGETLLGERARLAAALRQIALFCEWLHISGGMLQQIKYIAGYQTAPVSAITHYAPINRIEPYGEEGKYKLIFSEKAKPIGPIPFGAAPKGTMQSTRYTSFARLQSAKELPDLL